MDTRDEFVNYLEEKMNYVISRVANLTSRLLGI